MQIALTVDGTPNPPKLETIDAQEVLTCLQALHSAFIMLSIPDIEIHDLTTRIQTRQGLFPLRAVHGLMERFKALNMKVFVEEVEDMYGAEHVALLRQLSRVIRGALRDCLRAGAGLRIQYFD